MGKRTKSLQHYLDVVIAKMPIVLNTREFLLHIVEDAELKMANPRTIVVEYDWD